MTTATIVLTINGTSLSADVEFIFRPGDPGRMYGEPGDCYPPEPPEYEITSLLIENGANYFNATKWLELPELEEVVEIAISEIVHDA